MNERTSWEGSEKWYDTLVGKEGHYYHQHVILPKLRSHLKEDSLNSLLDLGCGQGILSRQLPVHLPYVGIDLSPSLIKEATKKEKSENHSFLVGDICKPLDLKKKDFSHATFILSLQNLSEPEKAVQNAAKHLKINGTLLIVLNHPAFRIPRQSSWGIDEEKKIQYRRIDRYLSPLKVPIQMQPGKGEASSQTWSFHYPLSAYSQFLKNAGFAICEMEEWISDKESTGPKAKMENRARQEFPLFLFIKAIKVVK